MSYQRSYKDFLNAFRHYKETSINMRDVFENLNQKFKWWARADKVAEIVILYQEDLREYYYEIMSVFGPLLPWTFFYRWMYNPQKRLTMIKFLRNEITLYRFSNHFRNKIADRIVDELSGLLGINVNISVSTPFGQQDEIIQRITIGVTDQDIESIHEIPEIFYRANIVLGENLKSPSKKEWTRCLPALGWGGTFRDIPYLLRLIRSFLSPVRVIPVV